MKGRKIKESRFPTSLFAIYFGVLLLMSGVHVGLIVFMNKVEWNAVVQSIIPMIYWALVAIALTLFTRMKIKETYEKPMHDLAKATEQVANGDFSVYVEPLHTTDKHDYLDVMILDFNKMVEELGSIETLKTDFVSNVSHEMKTPIAIIKNYAELLKSETITEEQRVTYAKSIEEASIRLSNLISNILKLNKLENQRILPEVKNYDVCRQLCDCVIALEHKWEEKGLEMELDMEEEAFVRADESLMELVWNNLLTNAIKFTEEGGEILIRQTREKERIQISVSDSGCGMDEETCRHIFDKFYQGDTSHSTEGNGLGLALVQRVLHLLDGEIKVDSRKGNGSTFTVLLPLSMEE